MRWFVILVLITAGCKRGQPDVPTPPPEAKPQVKPAVPPPPRLPIAGWTPDATLLLKLDEPVECFGYTIRPPKGYKKSHSKFDAEVFPVPRETIEWATPLRKD